MERATSFRSVFLVASVLIGVLAARPTPAAILTVDNLDGSGEGFNDTTPATPIAGNSGTTIGQQRLNAVQFGANIWGSLLASNVTIKVGATFDHLACSGSGATLGLAGPASLFRDFAGAPVASTYYASALADKLAGVDLNPGSYDINAMFNSAVDDGSCSFPIPWYYGLDGNTQNEDLVSVVLHELGHGLGFGSTVDNTTGTKLNGFDDAFMRFLEDHTTSKLYPVMTDAERMAAATRTNNLHWVGAQVIAADGSKTGGVGPMGHAHMYAPATLSPSSVSHWDTTMTPDEVIEPFYTGPIHDPGLMLQAFFDEGWTPLVCGDGVVDPGQACDDGNTNSGDGCSATCKIEACHTCSGQPSVCPTVADATACDDGVFCNGADQCSAGLCTVHPGNPCPGPDGDGNCSESCNEATDSCTAPDPDGSGCNDGDSCTVTDVCTAGACGGTPTCVDHFLCYQVKTTKNTIPFAHVNGMTLSDQFDTGYVFDATKPKRLCTPADKNGGGIVDAATHVKGYQIKAESLTPKHIPTLNVTVTNQLGQIILDVVKPDFLLVPSAKNLTMDPPLPGTNEVDNYKCYKAKISHGTAKFPKGVTVTIADQFTAPKALAVIKPTHLCTPVDLNGSGIKHPVVHQLCYKAKPAQGAPKHTPQLGLHVNNALSGLERLDTKKEEFLCVPSLKVLP